MQSFGAIAEAPSGVAELQHLVLVLGMTGHLHTSDCDDEPIARLVERSEVPQPVSGRKSEAGKKASVFTMPGDAALSVGHPGTPPPNGWEWFPMSAVACLESGHTPSRRYPKYWDGDIPWIGIRDAREHHGGRIEITSQFVTQAGLDNSAARLLPAGTVCLSRTASVGYVVEMGHSMATSQDFVNWVCSEALHPPFLVKLLLAENRALKRFSKGAVHQTIYFPEVKAFHVCLPPLAEQKRIVAKVDQLMAMLDDLEQRQEKKRTIAIHVSKASLDSLVNAEDPDQLVRAWERVSKNFGVVAGATDRITQLRRAVLKLALRGRLSTPEKQDGDANAWLANIHEARGGTSRGQNQKPPAGFWNIDRSGWTWAHVGDICDVGTGSTPLKSKPEYYDGDVPWITSAETSQEAVHAAKTFVSELAVRECRLKIYPSGTLLVAMYGQGKTRGQVTELRISATINQACAALTFGSHAEVARGFIKLYFKARYDELRELAAGGAQPNLNLEKIRSAVLPVPPPAEQLRIVATVARLNSIAEQLEKLLLQREFSGRRLATSACSG